MPKTFAGEADRGGWCFRTPVLFRFSGYSVWRGM